jgi:hypothetical protein
MKTNKLLVALLLASSSVIYSQTTLSVSVNNALNDHEEWLPATPSVSQSQVVGNMDAGSSDLELGNQGPTTDPQLVGVRFTSLTIPPNAVITNAYIQFAVDAANKNTDPCVLTIQVEDNANAAIFNDNPFCLSSRSLSPIGSSVTWSVSPLATWSVVGAQGADQRTSDIKSLVQMIVNKPTWVSGNAMAFYIKGIGTREVESFDGGDPKVPMLVLSYSTSVVGIEENAERSLVSLYPNPASGVFNLKVETNMNANVSIQVYDLTGKLVDELANSVNINNELNVKSNNQLTSGMYFVKVKINNKVQTLKFISE